MAVLVCWVTVLLATQAWPGIDEGIQVEFATDAGVYREMAAAAPGLPDEPVREQHAERWVVHWLVGSASEATGASLDLVYRLASVATVAAFVLVLHLALIGLGLSAGAYAVCLGTALASPYPFRYWLAAPGMVADAVFGLGLAVVLLGLVRRRLVLVVAGVLIATVARQTAVPAALVLAIVLAQPASSFLARRRERIGAALAVGLLPLVAYGAIKLGARGFSIADLPPLAELTIAADGPRQIASHLARLILGIALPLAALAANLGHDRREAIAPLAIAAAVIAQPFVLTSSWIDASEPRLAGLAVPALTVAAALLIRRFTLRPEAAIFVCVALFLGSLHHHYSTVDLGRGAWVTVVSLAALVTGVVLGAERRRSPSFGVG